MKKTLTTKNIERAIEEAEYNYIQSLENKDEVCKLGYSFIGRTKLLVARDKDSFSLNKNGKTVVSVISDAYRSSIVKIFNAIADEYLE